MAEPTPRGAGASPPPRSERDGRTRVQFAHGLEGSPRGRKARLLEAHFVTETPAMDTRDFEACVALHERTLQRFAPDVLVGSSFGGAVVVELLRRGLWRGPTLLLAQAALRRAPDATLPHGVPVWLVHGTRDEQVDPEDSRKLAATGDPARVRLLVVDDDHALHASVRSGALLGWVRALAREARPSLRERARRTAVLARERGALEPVRSQLEVVEEAGIPFALRVVESLERKRRAGAAPAGQRANPFLPWDPDLFVADLSDTHVVLLNKFNVLDGHLLVVTRAFEEQEAPLTPADWDALWRCLVELDGVGFYNAGVRAGASQPHRHLQVVPAPLGVGPERTPMDRVLDAAAAGAGVAERLPWRHRVVSLRDLADVAGEDGAARVAERGRRLLAGLGLDTAGAAYNLVATRDWLAAVPRAREHADGVSVNALGFAGALLARNRGERERIRRAGPLAVLRAVAEPRS